MNKGPSESQMDIDIIDISKRMKDYEHKIEYFIDQLGTEKRFFNLNPDRIQRSEQVLIATKNGHIAALAGLERKFGILRSYTMVRNEFQGKGVGRCLMKTRLSKASRKYNLILGLIDENNLRALRLDFSAGYRMAGKRGNLCYLVKPLNTRGLLVYYVFKILIPLLNVSDNLRR
jgi:predicted GNAT family acetyltransferase